jgi:hypothetical protein
MQTPLDPVDLAKLSLKDAVLDVVEFRGETTIVVDPQRIVEVCQFFRDTEGLEYIFLSDITAVDYFPKEPRFALCYHLYSMLYTRRLRIKVYFGRRSAPAERHFGVAFRRLGRARGIRHDGHSLRRASKPAPHFDARRLGRTSAAQGLSARL